MAQDVPYPVKPAALPGREPVEAAQAALAEAGSAQRGAIFTRREITAFILDLVGYTANRPLHERQLLEPAVGGGDFLLVAIERLLMAWQKTPRQDDPGTALADAVRGVELHGRTFAVTCEKVRATVKAAGIPEKAATTLADRWLIHADFLLTPLPSPFHYVVGNPPYVRHERIPPALLAAYRTRYTTVFDRADLYVPFLERSLGCLAPGGLLGFICADRWTKNRYGAPLRQLIADRFHLRTYIDMAETTAFQRPVSAYPAIIIIGNEQPGPTRVARRPAIQAAPLTALGQTLLSKAPPAPESGVQELRGVAASAAPWILESGAPPALARRLEQRFPPLEEAGCKVGIGVATGADQVFIGQYDTLDVEPSRKLPLAMTRDIASGTVHWRGRGLVNPFTEAGRVVDLNAYPRLKAYLEARKEQLSKRHIAKKVPAHWYRTIDRIQPALARQPKLLIPDIKGDAQVVYEGGHLYPHHNLYFMTSAEWDLHALQAVLRAGLAQLFVSVYSPRLRGGYLRFQAQYLRRIRLPRWQDVEARLKTTLIAAARRGDLAGGTVAVGRLYGLSKEEERVLGRHGR